jgi:lipid-binding SYLF domain-containing protein
MNRPARFAAFLLVSMLTSGCQAEGDNAQVQAKQQQLVDQATLTAEAVMDPQNGKPAQRELRLSKGVVICPSVFKMGFLFAGSGGGCVLLARDANGSWSGPSFYSIGSGSIGFQAGVQDEQLVLFIMSQRGLNAVMNTHFRLGGSAQASFATFGGGIGGSTSTALDADIVALELNKGLFAGISVEGSFLNSDAQGDSAYYGQPVGPEDIVVAMRVNNPGDDPLRAVLTKYGSPVGVADLNAPATIDSGSPAPYRTPAYQSGEQPIQLAPNAPVQQQSLPPPGSR